jgi:peptidoglycan/LPS O-acetylase OafA/YrhL
MLKEVVEARPGLAAVPRRPRLAALAGLRVVVALHIYFFHIMQAHRAGLLTFALLDGLPSPLARLLERGFISTGLFFQLSGLLLAYAYLNAAGRPKVSDRSFWWGRFIRLYPLYFLSLLLLIPAPALLPITAKPVSLGSLLGMAATNLTLTQAWFPSFAIAWNAPAWALSAFAFFYVVFPYFARFIAGWSRKSLKILLCGLIALSYLPVLAYLVLNPDGNGWTAISVTLGGFWLNVLRFDPLVWLPQFLSGIVLGRLIGLRVDGSASKLNEPRDSWVSVGDCVAGALVLFLAFVPDIPYVLLRHGLLVPITLAILADLAKGRGLIARSLAWRGFERVSEASFGLFALQMPAGVWFAISTLRSAQGTTLQLVGMISSTLIAAVLWTEAVQRPLLQRLRKVQSTADATESSSVPERPLKRRAAA